MRQKRLQHDPSVSDVLKKVFGFPRFRPNVFAVMPTGGGKSLCYQLPAKIMKGTTIVISPLISLMKDQVDAAIENGIAAAYMNSSLSPAETVSVYDRLKSNSLDLLYIAPERFAMHGFLETLKSVPVSLFAIDEAHCISEWGHDFRPDYLRLSNIAALFPDIPVAAFTATATQKVQNDISSKLMLRSPLTVRASFDRGNLFYRVESKRGLDMQLIDFLRDHADEPGIIYRTTRESVNGLTDMLTSHGIKALSYHAGLKQEERKANQETFNRDEVNIIVATIAFGMGIDKSNVRFVIHGDLPKNMEGYYQETGRAGRDGEPAECVLFFGRGDIPKMKYFIERAPDEKERKISLEKLNRMVKYASHHVCRRRQLLEYFGENYREENCGACDVCSGTAEKVDATVDARIFMSAMSRTGQRFGINHIVDIVTGADTKRIRELGHDGIKTYGAGNDHDKNHWRFIADELLAQEIIYQDGDRYPVLKLTEKGKQVLFGKDTVSTLKREEPKRKQRLQGGYEFGPYDEGLFQRLRDLRKKLADEQRVPPYIIFSDKTLHEICRHYPKALPDMALIHGVGAAKLERYGEPFTNAVKAYIDENPALSLPERTETGVPVERASGSTKGETLEKTCELFTKGLSIEKIAAARNLSESTISGHMEKLIMDGRDIDMDRLIEPAKRDEIGKLFLTLQSWQLSPVVEHFNGIVSYKEAKMVRAYMQRRSI